MPTRVAVHPGRALGQIAAAEDLLHPAADEGSALKPKKWPVPALLFTTLPRLSGGALFLAASAGFASQKRATTLNPQ